MAWGLSKELTINVLNTHFTVVTGHPPTRPKCQQVGKVHDDEPTLETAPANSLCFTVHEQLLIQQKLIDCDWLAHYLRLESECSYHRGLYSEAQKRRPREYRLSRSGTSVLACFRPQCSEFWEYLGTWYAMLLVRECSVPGRLTTR